MTEEHEKPVTSHKHDSDEESFSIKKTTMWQGAAAILGVLLVISIFTGGFGFLGEPDVTGAIVDQAPEAQPTQPAPAPRAEVEIGDSSVKGDEAAPVTIIEFSDFQCPFCVRHFSQTFSQIEEAYINTGKVNYVFKHFPLDNIHPHATPAALASECAHEQGKFWEFHNIAFENSQSLGDENYKAWAEELELDTEQFNDCYDSQKYLEKVRNDLQQGSQAGVRGTPGFLVNGMLVSGAQPFEIFQQVIESELNS